MCQREEPNHWCECDLIAKVRADERAKHPGIPAVTRATMDAALPMIYDMLRAQVHGLVIGNRTRAWDYFAALDDVIALLDGEE
jgi:hypothetical protein